MVTLCLTIWGLKMHNLYTDLDSILDTRHSLLYYLDKNVAKDVIGNNKYKNRKKDSFENISMDIFRTIYRHRNKEVILIAKPTHVCGLMSKLIIADLKDIGEDGVFNLYLNTYPYVLTLDEQSNLVELMDRLMPDFVGIKIINSKPDDIDPEWIKNNDIKTIFMYEALQWLEYNNANTKILTNPLTSVMLYGPDIIEGNISDKILTPEFFKNLTIMFGGIINYLPIEVKYFNTVLDVD